MLSDQLIHDFSNLFKKKTQKKNKKTQKRCKILFPKKMHGNKDMKLSNIHEKNLKVQYNNW